MKPTALFLLLFLASSLAGAQTAERVVRLAVLDFGNSATGQNIAARLAQNIEQTLPSNDSKFQVVDRDRARAAAAGVGYQGSLNMTVREAVDLGAAIGCDFYFTGLAETLRRSPSEGPMYFESYAAIYLVSARTGRLILWERPSVRRATPAEAERKLLEEISAPATHARYQKEILHAMADEREERMRAVESPVPIIEEAPDDSIAETTGLQLPRPYRRLRPPYPEAAAQAEVEAIVDVLVDLDAQGEVGRVQIARWAGYGLDQSVVETVRKLHFFPAKRAGAPIPLRVLLRYNFRKPADLKLRQ